MEMTRGKGGKHSDPCEIRQHSLVRCGWGEPGERARKTDILTVKDKLKWKHTSIAIFYKTSEVEMSLQKIRHQLEACTYENKGKM